MSTYFLASHTTIVGSDFDTYILGNSDAVIGLKGATSLTLRVRRTAETGTCTLDAFFEYFDPGLNDWLAWRDYAGSAILMVPYADGAVDTTGFKIVNISESPVGVDADGVLIYNVINKAYQVTLPEWIRVRFRHGGTTVSNTFSATLFVHRV